MVSPLLLRPEVPIHVSNRNCCRWKRGKIRRRKSGHKATRKNPPSRMTAVFRRFFFAYTAECGSATGDIITFIYRYRYIYMSPSNNMSEFSEAMTSFENRLSSFNREDKQSFRGECWLRSFPPSSPSPLLLIPDEVSRNEAGEISDEIKCRKTKICV